MLQYRNKLQTFIHFHPSLIFVGKAGANQSGALTELRSNGRLLTVPTDITLGSGKHSSLFRYVTITAVKSYKYQKND